MKRGLFVLAWLTVGHALLGGLYWLLLQIPESNVLMLGSSLLVVIVGIYGFGLVEATAMRGLGSSDGPAAALSAGLRRAAIALAPFALFVVIWLAVGALETTIETRRTEIDAWIIAKTGKTDTASLHTIMGWVLWVVRYGIGSSLALALLRLCVNGRAAGSSWGHWLARGLHWSSLVVTTLALLVGIWLPWQAAGWRPASLPVSWLQPTFAALKLGVLFVVMNAAWTVALWWASRLPTPAGVAPAVPTAPPVTVAAVEPAKPPQT